MHNLAIQRLLQITNDNHQKNLFWRKREGYLLKIYWTFRPFRDIFSNWIDKLKTLDYCVYFEKGNETFTSINSMNLNSDECSEFRIRMFTGSRSGIGMFTGSRSEIGMFTGSRYGIRMFNWSRTCIRMLTGNQIQKKNVYWIQIQDKNVTGSRSSIRMEYWIQIQDKNVY